jgi:hypothetical protein
MLGVMDELQGSVLRTLSANFIGNYLLLIQQTTYYLVYHKGRFALNFFRKLLSIERTH